MPLSSVFDRVVCESTSPDEAGVCVMARRSACIQTKPSTTTSALISQDRQVLTRFRALSGPARKCVVSNSEIINSQSWGTLPAGSRRGTVPIPNPFLQLKRNGHRLKQTIVIVPLLLLTFDKIAQSRTSPTLRWHRRRHCARSDPVQPAQQATRSIQSNLLLLVSLRTQTSRYGSFPVRSEAGFIQLKMKHTPRNVNHPTLSTTSPRCHV